MAKSKSARPEYCRDCQFYWAHGVKDGRYNRWCCKHAQPAPGVWKHCQLVGGKETDA